MNKVKKLTLIAILGISISATAQAAPDNEYRLVFSDHGRIEFQNKINAMLDSGCELSGNLQVENNALFVPGGQQSPRFFAQGMICPIFPPDELLD